MNMMWTSLKEGISGIRRLTTIDVAHVPVKIGGEIRDFTSDDVIDRKEARRMGRASQFALVAAIEAVEHAGLSREALEASGERVGVVIGTSLGSHEMSEQATYKYKTTGYRKPNPLALINALPNMLSHYVSHHFGAFGHLNTPSTACAAGTQAIGMGADLIRMGRCDIVICGAIEAILQDYTLAGFEAMNALATGYEDAPERASRPFDAGRSGFVSVRGGQLLYWRAWLLRVNDMQKFMVKSWVTHHLRMLITLQHLDPEGMGAYRAMRWALQDAHLDAGSIHYINAHGTSTIANDVMETDAIKRLLGDYAYKVPVSSTKSMLGHALAGSGAIEVVAVIQSLKDQVIAPTINYENPDPDCDLDYVPNAARDVRGMKFVLSNSFGLGGQNASIVLSSV
ncbi:beta-ketoacyl-[acyl-carrier-protein] synthase family protein [bacterium]|nr:beta-ketoacyl-[acyl-carrier-protein] synthase family protein [bacterium]